MDSWSHLRLRAEDRLRSVLTPDSCQQLLLVYSALVSDDEVLFHYTTAAGLLGILDRVDIPKGFESQIQSTYGSFSLWATDASFLNDSGELQFGRRQLVRALRRNVAPDSENDALVMSLDYMLSGGHEDPMAIAEDLYGPDRLSVYATCFCKEGDLLSQWRGYGTDKGYAIGFRKSALTTMVRRAGRSSPEDEIEFLRGVQLSQVHYGEDSTTFLQDKADDILEMNESAAWQACLLALAQVKADSFKSEREWRVFDLDRHNYTRCEYRVGPLGLTPYTRLLYFPDEGFEPIAKVYVGPGADLGLRRRAVEQLLRQRGFNDVEVVPSGITFRG